LKTPEEAREQLKKRFLSKQKEWLRSLGKCEGWPLEISLGTPSEAEASQDVDAVGAWAQEWRDWSGKGTIVWVDRRWKNLGRQQLPETLVLECPEHVAACVGEAARWQRAATRYKALRGRWPEIEAALSRYFDVLADYAEDDFLRLSEMLLWLQTNPASDLYPRQLPVAGVDSKWLETRTRLLTDLLCAVRGDGLSEQGFYERCGLRPVPALVRMRVLDKRLRGQVGGLSDISVPLAELVKAPFLPEQVFIVENLQTGLAFPDMPGAVLFMRLGYGVDVLGLVPWIANARLHYWGDCDTHGFGILNRARSYLPSLRSVLMDERTLRDHKALWGQEPEQHSAENLPLLTGEERAVYKSLKGHVWGRSVRLEQERIAWTYALSRLQNL
jgi:hypothetical protein